MEVERTPSTARSCWRRTRRTNSNLSRLRRWKSPHWSGLEAEGSRKVCKAGIAVSPGCQDLRPRSLPWFLITSDSTRTATIKESWMCSPRAWRSTFPLPFGTCLCCPEPSCSYLGCPLPWSWCLAPGSWLLFASSFCSYFCGSLPDSPSQEKSVRKAGEALAGSVPESGAHL